MTCIACKWAFVQKSRAGSSFPHDPDEFDYIVMFFYNARVCARPRVCVCVYRMR